MLLLMLNAELEKGCGLAPSGLGRSLDEPGHCSADVIAIGGHNIDRRPRQEPAFGARMTRTDRLVI